MLNRVKYLFCLIMFGFFSFSLMNGSDAGIFDSKDLQKCKNERIAFELKYKYCYRSKVSTERKLKSLRRQCQNERSNLTNQINRLNRKIESLNRRIENLKKKNKEDNTIAGARINELKRTIEILKKKSSDRGKKLLDENRALERRYKAELTSLKKRLNSERDAHLAELEALKKKYEDRIAGLLNTISNLNRELAALKKLSKSQKDELDRLASQEKELQKKLEREIRLGNIRLKKFHNKLIINIDNKISFASGSARLKKRILPALKTIAGIISDYPENKIMVEGHTDNLKMRTKKFKDNWQLSSERALAVLRFLLKSNKKLDHSRFIAAGYGKHQPIVPNNSRKNRSLNRRVDIVIIPRVPVKK